MKVYIGADHRGYELKDKLIGYLRSLGHEIEDTSGSLNPEDDYPQIASKLVKQFKSSDGPESKGILICSSGQGMAMAANRFKGIRACLCWDEAEARASRNDDDSNVLCLSSEDIKYEEVLRVVTVWLNTPFAEAPRFKRRIKELDELG